MTNDHNVHIQFVIDNEIWAYVSDC